MKAILVVDMPKSCEDCPLMLWDSLSEYYGACTPTLKEINCVAEEYKENENRSIRPNWCPLKPMPNRMDVNVKNIDDIQNYEIFEVANHISARVNVEIDKVFSLGWNACLEEINK